MALLKSIGGSGFAAKAANEELRIIKARNVLFMVHYDIR
jgi:hypothetical protein